MALKSKEIEFRRFKEGTSVNLYQEDWHPFQNLPNALKKFEDLTGVRVNLKWDELKSSDITDKMWNEMESSFTDEEPPYDLVCADPIIIKEYVYKDRVEELNELIDKDNYQLEDLEPMSLEASKIGNIIYGFPSCFVCNVLMYRVDLFKKYGIKVPTSMEELYKSACDIQKAALEDGNKDFYGITARGARGAGYIGWIFTSTWAPSWGVDLEEGFSAIESKDHISAIQHFVDLLQKAGPKEQPEMEWIDSLDYYKSGRSAMIIEVGTEFANLYKKGGKIIENSRCVMVPSGNSGNHHPGLYAPAYSIPKKSKVKDAAWELAKFLCSPEQQLEDALLSESIETVSRKVLKNNSLDDHFRPDLLEVTRQNRKYAKDERPYSKHGLKYLSILGDEYNEVLRNRKTAVDAMKDATKKIMMLDKD